MPAHDRVLGSRLGRAHRAGQPARAVAARPARQVDTVAERSPGTAPPRHRQRLRA
jgi:hypothetical protein